MKRNSVLGLLVFCNKEFTIVGTVKEIKLYDKDMKIKYFIINDKTLDKSFILPFNQCELRDAVLHCSKEMLIEIDNLEFYKEIRLCKEVFSYKNVFDENEEFIGKISDYSFNDETGDLENIYYYNYDKEETSIIKNQTILNRTISNILNNKNKNKETNETPKVENVQNIEVGKEPESIVKNDVVENTLNKSQIEEMKKQLILEDMEKIKIFKEKIEEEHENLKNIYLDLQKEIKEEFNFMFIYIESKMESLLNSDLKLKEEEFINKISEIYKQQTQEMVEKVMLLSEKINTTHEVQEKHKSSEANQNEANKTIVLENTIKKDEKSEYNRRLEDKDVLVGEDAETFNIYKIKDIKKQTQDSLVKTSVIDTDTHNDVSAGNYEEDNKIELNTKTIIKPQDNIDIISEEKNEKLEKLYQLQAKRMSIIDKMLKTKEY